MFASTGGFFGDKAGIYEILFVVKVNEYGMTPISYNYIR